MLQITLHLSKAGRLDLFTGDGVNKEDIVALLELLEPLEQRAKARTGKRRNTLRGEDWALCVAATEPREGDTPFATATKQHLRFQLGVLHVLQTVEKCKEVVGFFKRSGLNSTLECTLKQEVETRWNSMLLTLESFFAKPNQFQQVNVFYFLLRGSGAG